MGDSDEQAREGAAKALSDAQAPVMEGLNKVLERMTWLEEDNANLRKESETQRRQRFYGRLFKKKAE